MGSKRIRDALMGEAHHYAHAGQDAYAQMIVRTGKPITLEAALAAALLDGIEIGARLTAADVVCGRRLLATMEKALLLGGERQTVAASDRLLAALSK
jgi:hypothetical protein